MMAKNNGQPCESLVTIGMRGDGDEAMAGDPRANSFADRAIDRFRRDQELTDTYHRVSGGKWDGMMLQTHFGYASWQQPEVQTMPAVKRVSTNAAAKPIAFESPGASSDLNNGLVAIEAPKYTRALAGRGLQWRTIPNLGRSLGAVVALTQGQNPTTQQDAVRLEYDINIRKAGDLTLELLLVPTLDTSGRDTLHVGVSIDDSPMQVLIDRLVPAPTATTLQEQRDYAGP